MIYIIQLTSRISQTSDFDDLETKNSNFHKKNWITIIFSYNEAIYKPIAYMQSESLTLPFDMIFGTID